MSVPLTSTSGGRLTMRRLVMSNRPLALWVVLACCSGAARAQSPALLEAVRVHRPGVVELAKGELSACSEAKCPDADRLTLLVGYLSLSESDPAGAATQLSAHKAPAG